MVLAAHGFFTAFLWQQQTAGIQSSGKSTRKKLLDLLESRNQDCILVSHPIFINILLSQFRNRGYHISRRNYFQIAPLERIVITKWDMHCGGCGHNCLLTNPGSGLGEILRGGDGKYYDLLSLLHTKYRILIL